MALLTFLFSIQAKGNIVDTHAGSVDNRVFTKSYHLFFRINKWDMDTSFLDNGATIRRMKEEIDSLAANDRITSDSIFIVSAASPDGGNDYNMMLSRKAMTLSSQGIAAVHNLVCGGISGNPDIRETFFYEPHGTISAGKTVNRGGDFRWYNNLLLERASLGDWSNHELPIVYGANVVAAGAHAAADDHTAFADSLSDPAVKLVQKSDGWYLSMNVPAAWKGKIKCKTVTTSTLGKAVVPDQEFTNPDGSRLRVDRDYLGRKRSGNPSPGAFEIGTFGPQEWRVWPKQE